MTVAVVEGELVEATPGFWMSPADADTVKARLRTITAHAWRKVLILVAPNLRYKNFVSH